jgi:hypothetical protein
MKKKIFPIAVALAVTALFILPGLAFGSGGGGGNGTPSPPPTNPPCDSDGHNNQPPPYGGPNPNSGSCDNGTGTATGGSTGGSTGNACPPTSQNPGGDPDCGHGTTGGTTGGTTTGDTTGGTTTGGTTTGGTTTGGTTTGGATLNECHWDVTLGGMTVIPDSEIPGALGLHVDLPPDAAGHTTGSLVHGCVGVGSVVNPVPTPCPTGTAPVEVQTDQASYVLLCVLL